MITITKKVKKQQNYFMAKTKTQKPHPSGFIIDKENPSIVSQIMNFGYKQVLFDKMMVGFQTRYVNAKSESDLSVLQTDIQNYLSRAYGN